MKNKIIIIFISVLIIGITSCIKKDFAEPDVADCDPGFESNIALEDFINLYDGVNEGPFLIDTNVVIKGTVIANDKSGNFYKSFVIQDSTAAGAQTGLLISVDEYETNTKYKVGDMVYIKCEGLYLGYYGGVIQLGALFEEEIGRIEEPLVDLHIFNACGGEPIKPKVVTMDQLDITPVNTLVKIEDAQFKLGELDETYADVDQNVTSDQYITDCNGLSANVRTSGYSKFAGEPIPSGKGSIIVVKGEYNDDAQLMIRDINEVQFNDARCGAVYEKDFEEITFGDPGGSLVENLTSGNWVSNAVIGETNWGIAYYGGNNYGNCTNYDYGASTNYASEVWMISPSFDLTLLSTPVLNFMSATSYNGPAIEVKISVNYSGSGNPNDAAWTDLSPVLSPGDFDWVSSGDLNLSAYKESSVYIAFVYSGSDSDGATWEVDNIQLKDE